MKLIRPDWDNNLVGVSAALAEYLGCPNGKPALPLLQEALGGGYKNVVLLILDGLGMHPLRQTLPEDALLRRETQTVLTSVFPSTTTNATTSLRSGLFPMEHGWFGWSLYFAEQKRCVDLFPAKDSLTGEPLGREAVERRLPAPSFYSGAKDIAVSVVVPPYWEGHEENKYIHTSFPELLGAVEAVCARAGRQFVYAYCDMPDSVMHRFGVSSCQARETVSAFNEVLERLLPRLKDTLLIVTADHGQVDVTGEIEIYRDEELLPFLAAPPYLEARATAFRLREGCEEAFRSRFLEKYGEDFVLFSSKELIRGNYFGATSGGNAELLGDLIAVGMTDKIMRLRERSHPFAGHHTSLTEEEMLVPLILLEHRRKGNG